MPTGVHKHPHNSLLPELLRRRHHRGRSSTEEDEYLDSLLEDSSDRSSSSFEVTRPPRLGGGGGGGDEVNSRELPEKAVNSGSEAARRRIRSKKARGKFSYSALNLSNSRILRRHTTYVKSTSSVNEAVAASEAAAASAAAPKHVHSWHRSRNGKKKEGQQQQPQQKKRMSMIWNSKVQSPLARPRFMICRFV